MAQSTVPTSTSTPGEAAGISAGSYMIELSRAYKFDDEQVYRLDLSGLQNLRFEDFMVAAKALHSSGNLTMLPEFDVQCCIDMAVKATGYPVEFFHALAPVDGIRVKNRVISFLSNGV